MDHQKATTTQAAERYTLNELTIEERDAFEDHFFGCEECADAVRTCTLLAVNAKAIAQEESSRPSAAGQVVEFRTPPVRPAWRQWFSAVAAVLLLGVLGFQNMVTIPRLEKQAATPAPLASILLRPASRGTATVVHTTGSPSALRLDLGSENLKPSYEVIVKNVAGSTIAKFTAPAVDGVLELAWPSNTEPGEYEILVRDQDRSSNAILYRLHSER